MFRVVRHGVGLLSAYVILDAKRKPSADMLTAEGLHRHYSLVGIGNKQSLYESNIYRGLGMSIYMPVLYSKSPLYG